MDTKFNKLQKKDFKQFVDIVVNAYPGAFSSTKENKNNMEQNYIKIQEDANTNYYGAYRNDVLVGGMRFHDFQMNLLSKKMWVGGIGLVAVDLLRKKEKICRDIMCYSIEHFRKKGYDMAMLYPFKPEFYKKMGFGYGTKINQYRVKPQDIHRGKSKKHIRFATQEDKEKLIQCYNRSIYNINGMVFKDDSSLNKVFADENKRIIAYYKDDLIKGYIIFKFEKVYSDNFLVNDIHVDELIYENRDALKELLTFLNSQSDQIREIIINTQDEFFHHLLSNVRSKSSNLIPHVFHESNVQGVGIMYRIINLKNVFKDLDNHNFGNETCRLKLTIHDNLVKENNGSTFICFNKGSAKLSAQEEYDVEISMDISDFSSMFMGVVSFKSLYMYGLADISDENCIGMIDRIFAVDRKPMCIAKF